MMCCAAAAVIGHVWPIYHGFRGGKGAATLIGTLLILAPKLIPIMLLVFALMVVLTGYVGLSTMTAAAALPLWLGITRLPDEQPLFIYAVFMALFIMYCHRANIRRMYQGNENRNTRVMLFAKRGSAPRNEGD